MLLLLLPGAAAPSLPFVALMMVSALGWGFYTLAGKQATITTGSLAISDVASLQAKAVAGCPVQGAWGAGNGCEVHQWLGWPPL